MTGFTVSLVAVTGALVAGSLVRQHGRRWVRLLGWWLSRPQLDATNYPAFKARLALWKEAKPR